MPQKTMQPFPDAGRHLLGDLDSVRRVHPPAGLVLDWPVMTDNRALRSDKPLAVELTAALKGGEVDRLHRLLAANPGLAHCVVENAKGGGRTPLHLFADWVGEQFECCRD